MPVDTQPNQQPQLWERLALSARLVVTEIWLTFAHIAVLARVLGIIIFRELRNLANWEDGDA